MTDHRAVAAELMAETAAYPAASEHLLAAIHDLLAERLPEPLDPPDTAISVPSSGISWPKAKGGFVPQPSYDAEDFICAGCGRNLPCRHCLDDESQPRNSTPEGAACGPAALSGVEADSATREASQAVRSAHSGESLDITQTPRLAIEGDWLVRYVDEHTCGTGEGGYYGQHEAGCGAVPELHLAVVEGWVRPPGPDEVVVKRDDLYAVVGLSAESSIWRSDHAPANRLRAAADGASNE